MSKHSSAVHLVCWAMMAGAAATAAAAEPPCRQAISEPSAGGAADRIFFGGEIVTVDDRRPEAEALAVRGDRIVAVGDRRDVFQWRGQGTLLCDLEGGTLMPGLIEAHSHPVGSAWLYTWVDMSGFSGASGDEIMERLRRAVERAAPDEWVLGFGYDPMLTPDLPPLGLSELNALSMDKPILVLMQSMHTAYVNQAAFDAAGVTADTRPPDGGDFGKEEGELTGVVIESPAIMKFLAEAQPDCSAGACDSMIEDQLESYARAGVTTLGAVGLLQLFDRTEERLAKAARGERGAVRVVHYVAGNLSQPTAATPFSGDLRFRNDGWKLWIDGSPYTGTMLLAEPYLTTDLTRKLGIEPGSCGQLMLEVPELKSRAGKAHADGWQIALHAQGDRAVEQAIAIYTDVRSQPWPRPFAPRHRIEHLALANEEDLRQAAALGVTVSFHVNHIYYYGTALRDQILGAERAHRLMPIATALRHGHRVSLHADSPMYPVEPFLLMRTAVTRRTREGDVLGGDEAISVDDAIRAMTLDAAWQMHLEQELGSLEPGKLADLVILDRNPRTLRADLLHRIRPVMTYLAGRPVILPSP